MTKRVIRSVAKELAGMAETLRVYDVMTDGVREATQQDINRLQAVIVAQGHVIIAVRAAFEKYKEELAKIK